jgi:multiple sugar transport system substrate-binding protein
MQIRKIVMAAATWAVMGSASHIAHATTVEVWTEETESDRIKTIQLLMDTFQALNPDVTVKLVPIEENETATRIAAAAAANTLPNIVITNSDVLVAFGQQGLMDDAAASDLVKTLEPSRFYKGALKLLEGSTAGTYYAVPFNGWIQGLWYRADWFKEAGLGAPDTWENIKTAAEHFYKPEQNQYGILIGTQNAVYAEETFTPFALSNGVREFDEQGNIAFDSPEAAEALSYFTDLAKYGPPGPQTWRARDYYIQGKLAMFFYSTFIMDDLALADAAASSLTTENFKDLQGAAFDPKLVENTGVVTTIKHKVDGSFGSIQGVGILKSADPAQAKAAAALASFLFEPSSYITWMHMSSGGFIPVLRDVATGKEYLDDPKGLFKHYGEDKLAALMQGFENMGTFRIVGNKSFPKAGEIFAKAIIPQMVYSATFEGKAPEQAVKDAAAAMKQVAQ